MKNERSYFKRASPATRPSELNFYDLTCDLVIIMTWYLGWGDFIAWNRSSEFLVNRIMLTKFDTGCPIIMLKIPLKCPKRKLLPWKYGGFYNMLFTAIIFGWEVAQGVYNNLQKQLEPYLWSPGKYSHKHFCSQILRNFDNIARSWGSIFI